MITKLSSNRDFLLQGVSWISSGGWTKYVLMFVGIFMFTFHCYVIDCRARPLLLRSGCDFLISVSKNGTDMAGTRCYQADV